MPRDLTQVPFKTAVAVRLNTVVSKHRLEKSDNKRHSLDRIFRKLRDEISLVFKCE